MTEVLFYHLQRQPLERVLPQLLEKTLERGWKAVVQTTAPERVEALDAHLWTYAEESFLPHTVESDPAASDDPIVVGSTADNPNQANVRFLVDNATIPDDAVAYERLVLMFDGNDEEALALARRQLSATKAMGHAATYWQQNDAGRWEKKA